MYSAHAKPPPDAPYDTIPVHVTFLDWIPGIFSILGMIIINLIDKDRLTGEGAFGGAGDSRAVWRARLVLFLGFAMMAGGLAGSVVSVDVFNILRKIKIDLRYAIRGAAEVHHFRGS